MRSVPAMLYQGGQVNVLGVSVCSFMHVSRAALDALLSLPAARGPRGDLPSCAKRQRCAATQYGVEIAGMVCYN